MLLELFSTVLVLLLTFVLFLNHQLNSPGSFDLPSSIPLWRASNVPSEKPDQHRRQLKVPIFDDNVNRIYIVAGCGFLGSWVARYLVIRGDVVHIVDKKNPKLLPPDLVKHGATYHQLDLTSDRAFDQLVTSLKVSAGPKLVVFHCAAVTKYHSTSFNLEHSPCYANVHMAHSLTTTMSKYPNSLLIFFNDALVARKPVHWWKLWDSSNWVQTTDYSSSMPSSTRKFINDYAESMWLAEHIILQSTAMHSASLRLDGFVSGHVQDSLLTPAILYHGALLHSKHVPISLLHVEDVVACGLYLESRVEKNASSLLGKSFTLSSNQVTTLEEIYKYISLKRPFGSVKINPTVVLLLGYVWSSVQFVRSIFVSPTSQQSWKNDNLLCGATSTLTLSRFNTLSIGQLPNPFNNETILSALGFIPTWSTAEIIGGVIDEISAREGYDVKPNVRG